MKTLLEGIANGIRIDAIELTARSGSGHLGGTFSCVEILVALYYKQMLNQKPDCPDRDRFILSKGHACLALYPILANFGYITTEQMNSYGEDGGFGGQLDINIPGVDWNTGSLGHSVGVCAGIALGAKLSNKSYYAFTLIGDAECSEGSVWEAINFAADHKLDNLVCIVDRNRLSVTDTLDDDSFFAHYPIILDLLGWTCIEVDGHDIDQLISAFNKARDSDKPTMIIANTIKGKGVSFMEGNTKWHHGGLTEKELEIAREELR